MSSRPGGEGVISEYINSYSRGVAPAFLLTEVIFYNIGLIISEKQFFFSNCSPWLFNEGHIENMLI